jgi:hypothetical protein
MKPEYKEPEIAQRLFNAADHKSAQEWLGKDRTYGGYVYAAGTALSLPVSWTSAKTGTGAYTVTHNLGSASYTVVITAAGSQLGIASIYTINANTFTLSMFNTSAVLTDCDFTFILLPVTQ